MEVRYGIEDIDRIDWMTREEAESLFEQDPTTTLKRPSAIGYELLGLPVPADLDLSWLS